MSTPLQISVQLYGNSPEPFFGTMHLQYWEPREAQARARKRIFKILRTLFVCSLIGLVLHLLLLIIVPTLLIVSILSIPVYFKWSSELLSCLSIQGVCPSCKTDQILKPFLFSRYQNPLTVQCGDCGQTCKAVVINEEDVPGPKQTAGRSPS